MRYLANSLILLLLLAGIGVLSYPTVSNWLATRNHSVAIQEYSVTVEQLTSQAIREEFEKANQYNASLEDLPINDVFVPNSVASRPGDYTSILQVNGMIGYVQIPVIDVNLPVYHLTTEDVLLKGVGHMDATAFPVGGPGTHAVLTAHRGLPTAKLFTDLNKLEDGDLFFIQVLDQTLAYQVDRELVVEPGDTEELRPVPGKDYVTLVTCTPYAINSHRLLVRGTRIEAPPTAVEELQADYAKEQRRWVWLWVGAGAAAAVPVASWIYRRRGKNRRLRR